MSLFYFGKELLKEGAKGEMIEKLQGALESAGANPGKKDGLFGPKTKKAVEAFQSKAGLKKDGVVGPMTAKALKQAAINAAKKAGGNAAKAGASKGATAKGAVNDIMGAVGGLFGGDD